MQHHLLAEAMRRHGQTPGSSVSLPRFATVENYDPELHSIRVLIQPEGVLSAWMPLGTIGAGSGWGVMAAPRIGDQAIVVFPCGDFSSGVVVSLVFDLEHIPPKPALQSGEILIQHASGSLLRFNNDGTVNLVSQGTLTSSAPEWNHKGPMNIDGDVATTGALTNNGVNVGSTHTHSGVRSGGDTSGPPA